MDLSGAQFDTGAGVGADVGAVVGVVTVLTMGVGTCAGLNIVGVPKNDSNDSTTE